MTTSKKIFHSLAFAATRASLGRYATVETAELRIPLECGWRRETLVREYSKSGVRGDVVYYAPCGKKFKQYPDIVRVRICFLLLRFGSVTVYFLGNILVPKGAIDIRLILAAYTLLFYSQSTWRRTACLT